MEVRLPHHPPGARLTVGFLTTAIGEGTGRTLWSGIHELCQTNGVSLVTFAGSELENPAGFQRQANMVFDLVNRDGLDGLIIWASSMATYVGVDAAQRFFERYRPLPMVGIGLPLIGIPSIVLDSYQGMRDAMLHLVQDHGRRRVAFLRGPERHREANLRYLAYLNTVREYGLDSDPDLVTPPHDWSQSWGSAAVRLLVEERGMKFDAIACVNDGLAVGAMEYLQSHGFDVPGDVAITGFDNTPEGRVFTPPLTTVPIRMRERGRQAMRVLLAQIRGETVPELHTLPTHVLMRQSCGCPDPLVVEAGQPESTRSQPNPAEEVLSWSQRLAGRRAEILMELDHTLDQEDAVPGWALDLLDAFLHEMNTAGETPHIFLTTLQRLLLQSTLLGGDLLAWQKVISVLRARALPLLRSAPAIMDQAERCLHQARVMIGGASQRAQGYLDWKSSTHLNELHRIRQVVSGVQDIQEQVDLLARELPDLGIRQCSMALYLDPAQPLEGARLVLGFDETRRRSEREGEVFRPAGRLLSTWPEGSEPTNVMVYPLYFRNEQLGFILLDAHAFQGTIHQVLCEQISSALKSVMLIEQNIQLYRQALEAQHVAEEANLLKSRFLSMVSHELLTPMVLLVGLSEMMLREGIGDRPALPEPYRQDLTRIHAGAQQLGSLVRDVLDLARSQLGQLKLAPKTTDLAEMLKPVVLVGEQMARSKGLVWRTILPDTPIHILGDGARLQQVALNLVSNAVKFTTQGEVALTVTENAGQVTIAIKDTGLGVPLAEQVAIFDEFRQSERSVARGYGGLGIGLAICRQLIELHQGKIGVESNGEENGGSTFYFTLPVVKDKAVLQSSSPSQSVLVLTNLSQHAARLNDHLTREGFQVETIGMDETPGWLAQVLAAPPGAVVLDLPSSEHGWELIELFKANPVTQDIPVIFYSLLPEASSSADAGTQPVGSMLELDYLAKPVAAVALSQMLQRFGLVGGESNAGCTLLLADDDPEILDLHARMVAEHVPGCKILRASNGRIALQLMRETLPTLVLLDLMMPELDGTGVVRAMQEDAKLREVPVIVLTAQTLTQDEMAQLNRGVTAVLSKGVYTSEETMAHIFQALKRTKRLGNENQRLSRRVMAYIHQHFSDPLTREQLASYAGVSERHLNRFFMQETGLAPMAYLNRFRIKQARSLLKDRSRSITEVMCAVGYSDRSHFTRVFRREAGVSPSEFQRGKR